jgi:hypothetical protein
LKKSTRLGFEVKRKYKRIQDFLFLAFILFLMVLPAFHECHDLMDLEIFSPPPHFEQFHPEQMASNRRDNWEGLESDASHLMLLLPQYFFKQFFHHFPPIFSLGQQVSVLRC